MPHDTRKLFVINNYDKMSTSLAATTTGFKAPPGEPQDRDKCLKPMIKRSKFTLDPTGAVDRDEMLVHCCCVATLELEKIVISFRLSNLMGIDEAALMYTVEQSFPNCTPRAGTCNTSFGLYVYVKSSNSATVVSTSTKSC